MPEMSGMEEVDVPTTDANNDEMFLTEGGRDVESARASGRGKKLDMDGMEGMEIYDSESDFGNTSSSLEDEEEAKFANNQLIRSLPPILRLPTEVFQIIQWYMDTGSFFVSLLTCKHFLKAATSKTLLSYQLRQLPGLGLGLEELEDDKLLHVLRTRAGQSGRAAGVLANVSKYVAEPGCMTAKSAFTWHDAVRPCSKHSYLAVPQRSGTIQIYELSKHPVRKREDLHIDHEDCNHGRIDILKVAFAAGSKDLGVLCSYERSFDEGFTDYAKRCSQYAGSRTLAYKLVVFHRLYAKQKNHFFSSSIQETRVIDFPKGGTPVGFALAQNGIACVLLNEKFPKRRSMVYLVHRRDKLMESCTHDSTPPMTVIDEPTDNVHSFSAQFSLNSEYLSLFKPGHPIHSWYFATPQSEARPPAIVNSNSTWIDVDKDNSRYTWEVNVGKPFYEKHVSDIREHEQEDIQCRRSWLSLGFAERPPQGHRVPSVFVMQSDLQKDATDCDHNINLENRVAWWKPIALLGGFRQGETTLGTIVAISPDGTRIAAAVWDRILLWTLDPKLLVEGDLDLYFPPWDYNAKKGIGRLRPTILSSSCGIVHGMQWTNEDNLFAVTDRGLVKWDLGCMSKGIKENLSLTWDTWPTNALNVPAPGTGDEGVHAALQGLDDD